MSRRRWLFLLLGLSVLLPAVLCAWLLGTTAGLRFAFARTAAALPDLALRAETIDGRLGALRLSGVSLRVEGRSIEVASLQVDWQPLALIAGTLDLQQVRSGRIRIAPPPADSAPQPFDPDRFSWSYPLPRLPLSVKLDDAELGPATLAATPLWDRLAVAGSIRGLRLELQRLELDRGRDAISLQGRLPAGADAPGLRGRWRWSDTEGSIALVADSRSAALAISADQQRAELALSIQSPRTWQLRFRARDAQLAALLEGIPEPLNAEFSLRGEGALASASGSWLDGPVPLRSLRGGLRWDGQVGALRLDGLRLEHVDGGSLGLDGKLILEEALSLELDAAVDGWPLPGGAGDAAVRLGGQLSLRGALDDLALLLDGALQRGAQQLPVTLNARWQTDTLRIERLQTDGPGGRLRASGSLRTAPQIALDLALHGEDFDPGWLLPSLDGSMGFDAGLQVDQVGDDWRAALHLDRLDGRWRDAPIRGSGTLALAADALDGALTIALGEGQLQLRADGERIDLTLQRIPLFAIEPRLAGALDGSLSVQRIFGAPSWEANLSARDMAWDALRIGEARLAGGLDAAGQRVLRLDWQGAAWGDALKDVRGSLRLDGNRGAHQAALEVRGPALALDAAWRGQFGDAPAIDLVSLSLDGALSGSWVLERAGPIRFGSALQVAPHCLRSGEATLCLQPEESERGERLVARLEGLPLQRLLALAGAPESLVASGHLSSRIALHTAPSIELDVVEGMIEAGELRDLSPERPVSLLAWDSLNWTLASEDEALRLLLAGRLQPEGQLRLQLAVPRSAPLDSHRWQGTLDVDIDQLQALALLAPDLTAARGALRGRMRWEPGLPAEGDIALVDFNARIPQLGIAVRDSSLSLRQDDGVLQLDGVLNTGEGPLRIEGSVQPGAALRARLRVAGKGVLLADTRRLSLRASPELSMELADGRLRLRGEVSIPQALIDLERLEAGVQVSPDVVVLDPRGDRRGVAAMPLDAELKVVFGEDVRLNGFGFDGGISGTLALRERPGQPMLGRGTLDLRGSYRAYGQELEIDRGRLLFASSSLDNPGIDLRARRPLREVEVGVEVRGPARRPQLSLWSRPLLDQAEALSWLILGQPLASATKAEGAQLGQAAAAVGGNLLAARVGGRLGFDTFGVADSEALGGAAFTVGKYLSPRLYLSYGVALFEDGRVITLRYLISRSFDIELEAARESRAGVNYRLETD